MLIRSRVGASSLLLVVIVTTLLAAAPVPVVSFEIPTPFHTSLLVAVRGGQTSASSSDPAYDDSSSKRKVLEESDAEHDDDDDGDDDDAEDHGEIDATVAFDAAADEEEEEVDDHETEARHLEGYDSMGEGDGTDLEEDNFVMEEVVYKEDTVLDEEEDMETILNEDDAAPLESSTTQEVLERATAGFQTDDENSSAFVDRMELADAYDLEEVAGVQEDEGGEHTMAAVSAATAVGPGGSDPDSEVGGEPPDETAVPEDEASSGVVVLDPITDEMKEILVRQLKFKPTDIKVLRPDIAAMVIANKLQKPVEGMPPNWYLPGAIKPQDSAMRKRLLKASAAIFTMGAVALVAKGQDINLDDLLELLQKIPAALVGIPVALLGSSKSPAALPLVTTVEEESLVEEESTEEVAGDDDHPHSLKPGSSHVPSFEGDLDKTALDKFITMIENGFKSFFRMQI